MFDKSVKLDIACPGCGYVTKMSISEVERNPTYICAGCKKEVTVDASELTKGLKDVEKQIKDTFN